MKHVVVLTGAGMSAESGLATFRDSGGLWEGYDINDVASIDGWHRDPETVLQFYNLRRKQAANAEPNDGHFALAHLETSHKVTVVTQNVDDLHERAGSTNVLHLHGELCKARSTLDSSKIIDIGDRDILWGDKAEDGAQLRPHIVWFGEMVPMIESAVSIVSEADILIVIGSSLVVYPAAGLIDYAPAEAERYVIDPSTPELGPAHQWRYFREGASIGTPRLVKKLMI